MQKQIHQQLISQASKQFLTRADRSPPDIMGAGGKFPRQFIERLTGGRELDAHFVGELFEVVAEVKGDFRKHRARTELISQFQSFQGDPQLAHDPGQGQLARAFWRCVGQGVQAHIIGAAAEFVERVQAAPQPVPFLHHCGEACLCQSDSSGETRRTRTDYDGIRALVCGFHREDLRPSW